MATVQDTPAPLTVNASWKVAAAVGAVILLSAPSAVGVYRALEPTRGPWAAGAAALGFELAYLSLSLLVLRPALRAHARMVALGAVTTAIVLNALADYTARIPGGLESWAAAVERFDPLALGLAVVESAPLAGLAFALASLLHRLAEEEGPKNEGDGRDAPAGDSPQVEAPALAWARVERYPAPVRVEGAMQSDAGLERIAPHQAPAQVCPRCGAELDRPRYLAARRWGRCASCKEG